MDARRVLRRCAVTDAIRIVLEHGGFLSDQDQNDLISRLNGRWERAIVKAIREIVRNEDISYEEKVRKLHEFVREAGLQIPERAEPLPPVRIDDVRVICWMSVAPAGN